MRGFFLLTGGAIVALALICVGFYIAAPWIGEAAFRITCSEPPDPACLRKMRGMGDLWSMKGNLPRAQNWYQRAADYGDARAMFHLAWVYQSYADESFAKYLEQMIGRTKDGSADGPPANFPNADKREQEANYQRAGYWYRKSAEREFAPAMNNLGELYRQGLIGVFSPFARPDDHSAFIWHLAAARAGNLVGAMNLMVDYSTGRGVGLDIAEAAKWGTWNPKNGSTGDLSEPTFSRTLFFGEALPSGRRYALKEAAGRQVPITTKLEPLKPDPRLPHFSDVTGVTRVMK